MIVYIPLLQSVTERIYYIAYTTMPKDDRLGRRRNGYSLGQWNVGSSNFISQGWYMA